MIIIFADDGPNTLNELQTVAFNLENSSGPVGENIQKEVRKALTTAEEFCDRLQLLGCKRRIRVFLDDILGGVTCTREVVFAEFFGLSQGIVNELAERRLVFIPPDRLHYLEQEALFGDVVKRAFPSAQLEIKNAGNCLSVGLGTAAVFHLMRVVEIGLRALALDLKAVKKGQIEFLDWGTIIGKIEKRVKDIQLTAPKGKKKSDDLGFYLGVLMELNAFKDVWRNNVMHTRTSYDERNAIGVQGHVRTFMQKLADGGLKETR